MTTARSILAGSCFLLTLAFPFAFPAHAQKPSPNPCCLSALEIFASPSVELLVTAPNGLKTGFDPVAGRNVHQIPTSAYYPAFIGAGSGGNASTSPVRKIEIGMPATGRYMVQAIGQSTGSFTLEFSAHDSKGVESVRKFVGSASPAGTFVYDVRYAPAPGSKIRVARLVPLSRLSADVTAAAGPPPTFQLKATFTLGSASSGVHPLTDPVSFHLAGYAVTIPPGSFKRSREGNYAFDGTIAGVPLRVRLAPQAAGGFGLQVQAQNIGLTQAINPVRFLLIVGQNAGATFVNAVTQTQ